MQERIAKLARDIIAKLPSLPGPATRRQRERIPPGALAELAEVRRRIAADPRLRDTEGETTPNQPSQEMADTRTATKPEEEASW